MSYQANKTINLSGTLYQRGQHVPDKVVSDIPEHRRGALLRTRLLIEVETGPKPAGDMCTHCGEGPFQRLAQHISLKHEDVLLSEELDTTDSPNEEEE